MYMSQYPIENIKQELVSHSPIVPQIPRSKVVKHDLRHGEDKNFGFIWKGDKIVSINDAQSYNTITQMILVIDHIMHYVWHSPHHTKKLVPFKIYEHFKAKVPLLPTKERLLRGRKCEIVILCPTSNTSSNVLYEKHPYHQTRLS